MTWFLWLGLVLEAGDSDDLAVAPQATQHTGHMIAVFHAEIEQ
jgi:hypothetical protein